MIGMAFGRASTHHLVSTTRPPIRSRTPGLATITKRQAVHKDELLADHELGGQVLKLRAEKDRLLDTVWLACSSAQIKQLWSSVTRLLGDEPTELERDTLASPPAGEEG